MTTLREAATMALEAWDGGDTEWFKRAYTVMENVRAALAEPVQEPVAWVHTNGTSDTKWHSPQRKPLTEEEIDSIWDSEKAFADIYAIARAIERAHGIDGAPEERNFCPRCGKRTNGIHTCTPPAPLTDEVIAELWHQNGGFHHHFARAIERWLKGNP